MSETDKNRGGRPRVDATPVTVRLPPPNLTSLDAWIAAQPAPRPSRPEAIRRLLGTALAKAPSNPPAHRIPYDLAVDMIVEIAKTDPSRKGR